MCKNAFKNDSLDNMISDAIALSNNLVENHDVKANSSDINSEYLLTLRHDSWENQQSA